MTSTLFKNYTQLVDNGETPVVRKKRKDALDILTAAVAAVNPYTAVRRVFAEQQIVVEKNAFDLSHFDHIYVVGFGKASVGMAQAVVDSIPVTKGIVITNDPLVHIQNPVMEIIVGGHPLPNKDSIHGTEKILDIIAQCGERDLLLVLISGGGSALLCKSRVNLHDAQKTTELLLKSGAGVKEINTVRKHLSLVKGGQLITHAKGVVVSLVLSDIVQDPLEFIASGPTCPDSTTFADAKEILERYQLWEKMPSEVIRVITAGINGEIPETPKKGDPVFNQAYSVVVGNNKLACTSALEEAKNLGYDARIFSTSISGEARTVGTNLVTTLLKEGKRDRDVVVILGGETTVSVRGKGVGGRSQEIVLGCIEVLSNTEMVFASFATDGIDGNSVGAGALADGFSLSRAQKKGLLPSSFLEENNSHEFFMSLGDVLCTGPTGTNVMDLQVLIF